MGKAAALPNQIMVERRCSSAQTSIRRIFQKTTTDANERFSFSYPLDKTLTIFAKAERLVGDKTEKLHGINSCSLSLRATKPLC
jgi:hypothetical protein